MGLLTRLKNKQPNSPPAITCPCCGVEFRAVGELAETWRAEANAQRFERVSSPHAPLTQTWPPKAPHVKSATRVRIEQSIVLGAAIVLCVKTGVSLVGWSLSLTATLKWAVIVSSGTFALSVAFGSDNWQTIFRWLDRNGDGRLTWDDIQDAIDERLGGDRESVPAPQTAPNIKRGLMLYNGHRGLQLLPELPEHQIRAMARKTAVLYLSGNLPDNVKENFTGRYLGRPWGDYLNAAKATLSELGYVHIVKGNNTYTLTDAGKDWLLEAVEYV